MKLRYWIGLLLIGTSISALATDHLTILDEHTSGVGGTVTYTLQSDMTYTVTATPKEGYKFLYWMDDESADNPRTYTVVTEDSNQKCIAVFGKKSDLELEHLVKGSVDVSTNDINQFSFFLTPTAVTCGTFTKWSDNSSENPRSYIESEGTVIPIFTTTKNEYTKEDNPGGHIEVTPHTCGYTLTAVPDDGYHFVKWTEDDVDSEVKSVSRDIDEVDMRFGAVFASASVAIGETGYSSIADAVNAASSTDVITILGDISEDVVIDKKVTIDGGNNTIGNLTIALNGDLTLTGGLKVTDLILNATTGASSQLRGESNLTYTNAYIDIKLEANNTVADPMKWYAFALPFNVDVANGVARQSGSGTHTPNVDYLIWQYDGDLRADNSSNGWVQMLSGTMVPGQFYMIGIDGNENIWRFTKKDGNLGGANPMTLQAYKGTGLSADSKHQGWNAIGNSTLTYADAAVSSGISIAQVYMNGAADAYYHVENLGESSFVMSSPFFVQTADADQITFSSATHTALFAPARNREKADYYKVQLLRDGVEEDVVYLTVNEDAQSEYTIGKDVMKMMGGKTHTYLYTRAYDTKLCAQDVPFYGDVAYIYLGIETPKDGIYQLHLDKTAGEEVFVTNDDIVVWNLTDSDYELYIPKGTSTNYGLLIRKTAQAPTDMQTTTNKKNVQKFIWNGQMFINVQGSVYNVLGGQLK